MHKSVTQNDDINDGIPGEDEHLPSIKLCLVSAECGQMGLFAFTLLISVASHWSCLAAKRENMMFLHCLPLDPPGCSYLSFLLEKEIGNLDKHPLAIEMEIVPVTVGLTKP